MTTHFFNSDKKERVCKSYNDFDLYKERSSDNDQRSTSQLPKRIICARTAANFNGLELGY